MCQGVGLVLGDGRIKKLNGVHDSLRVSLHNASIDDNLIDKHMRLVNVEHDVQLTNVAKVPVEGFYHEVNQLENAQLILIVVDANNEIQGSISSVNDFVILIFDKQTL
jgi:hypothetical protein